VVSLVVEQTFDYAAEMAAPARVLDQQVIPGALATERTIAVHPALAMLFPQGLVRGSSVVCLGAVAVSTAFLLTAAATQTDSWIGVAGLPAFGAQACHEMGTVLERVVMVRDLAGSPDDDSTWASVLGALVDGFDIVVFGAAHQVRPATARRVQARLQTRGCVLVLVGDAGPFAADVRVSTAATWQGLGDGNGYLRQRTVEMTVDGRRVPRARHDLLAMPGVTGDIESLASLASASASTSITVTPTTLRRTG
jgi:hypothetical protein